MLLDAEITLPKFCKLIKVSDKNIQSYKKKDHVPNAIAAVAACFVRLHHEQIDYQALINDLGLKKKTKSGGFKKKPLKKGGSTEATEGNIKKEQNPANNKETHQD